MKPFPWKLHPTITLEPLFKAKRLRCSAGGKLTGDVTGDMMDHRTWKPSRALLLEFGAKPAVQGELFS